MTATPAPHSIREYAGLDAAAIRRDVLPDKRPAILRGLVRDWPAVKQGLGSPAALVRYLNRFDSGKSVDALLTAPELDGQIFYNDTMTGFNFLRNQLPLTAVAEQVLRYAQFPKSPAVAAQSALIRDCLPGFSAENSLDIVDDGVLPRIWLGNRITTPTHVDEWNNVGCVVAGHRRFTLFPPEQIANLYIGPVDFAPLESFNVLVNYWWHDTQGDGALADSGFDALLHGILGIRALPPATRRAWAAFFERYVFGDGAEATAHIPEQRHGILGTLSAEQLAGLRARLAKRLAR